MQVGVGVGGLQSSGSGREITRFVVLCRRHPGERPVQFCSMNVIGKELDLVPSLFFVVCYSVEYWKMITASFAALFGMLSIEILKDDYCRWNQNWGLGIGEGFCAGTYTELPMFRWNVDSFPFRRISGTPTWPFLAKVMPNFFVNFWVMNSVYN